MYKSKKAISPVIAVILLLAITVVISMSMYSFLDDYTESTTSSLSSNEILGNVEIQHIFANNLFLNSENNVNLSLLRISDSQGTELCSFSGDLEIDSTGLVGHWTFDEIINQSGTLIIEDISGNGNNGTLLDINVSNSDANRTARLVKSNNGYAISFDGIDDYLEIKNSSSLNFVNQSNFTYVIKLKIKKINSLNSPIVLQNLDGDGLGRSSVYISYFQSYVSHLGNIQNLLSQEVEDNNYEVLFVNGIENSPSLDTLRLFKGNTLNFEGNLNFETNLNGDYVLGRPKNELLSDRYFKGEIDELRFYNRTLSDLEIKNLYWILNKNQQSGISQIDVSSCNLQKNKQYKITLIANGEKIESTQIVN